MTTGLIIGVMFLLIAPGILVWTLVQIGRPLYALLKAFGISLNKIMKDEEQVYTVSLDAMHEVIKKLNYGQQGRFCYALDYVLSDRVEESEEPNLDQWQLYGYEYLSDSVFGMIFATPAQLLEAYLRTLNLWTD